MNKSIDFYMNLLPEKDETTISPKIIEAFGFVEISTSYWRNEPRNLDLVFIQSHNKTSSETKPLGYKLVENFLGKEVSEKAIPRFIELENETEEEITHNKRLARISFFFKVFLVELKKLKDLQFDEIVKNGFNSLSIPVKPPNP